MTERILGFEEQQKLQDSFVDSCVSIVDFAKEITPKLGTSEQVGQDIDEYAAIIGLPTTTVDSWKKILLKEQDGNLVPSKDHSSSLHQYLTYLQDFKYESREAMENFFRSRIKETGELAPFLYRLVESNSLVGASAFLLYQQSLGIDTHNNISPEISSGLIRWYKDSLEGAARTTTNMDSFFGKVANRLVTSSDGLAQSFVRDWQEDIRLSIFELVHLASGMAIHVQGEERCAVFFSAVPFPIPPRDFEQFKETVLTLEENSSHPDGRTPLYTQYSKPLFDYLRGKERGNMIWVPIPTSVFDIKRCFNFYEGFWKQVASGMKEQGKHTVRKLENGASVIELGNAAELFLRSEPTRDSQGNIVAEARIKLEATGNYGSFSLRVDQEKRGGGLAFDTGGTGFDNGIAYARSIQELDRESECVMNYGEIVEPNGAIKLSKAQFAPSVMMSAVMDEGSKSALMAAVAMREGELIGMRRGESYFLHHSRERISANPRYTEQFPDIVHKIKTRLSQNAPV